MNKSRNGSQPISYTEIKSWLELNGFDGPEQKDLAFLIKALDSAWFGCVADKKKLTQRRGSNG